MSSLVPMYLLILVLETATMTKPFEQLKGGPQTDVHVNRLNLEERMLIRRIKIDQASTVANGPESGRFTAIFYLEGDEYRAAELFVEENRDHLEAIDFSKRNILQTSLPQEIYDWILHHLGERELQKLETVVYEKRQTGVRWIIDRELFEQHPNRRYTTSENQSARIDNISLDELYESFDTEIRVAELDEHDAVSGNVRYILEYYRIFEEFNCDPVSIDNQMAIRKRN
ncbi:hypothetical protein [Natronorubrum aibiense]|nr:hypothetical protein [Natronorubrum aibiense]